jgi:hypothetical protein
MEMNGKPIDYIHTTKVNNNKTNTKNNSKHQSQRWWWWWMRMRNFGTRKIYAKKRHRE